MSNNLFVYNEFSYPAKIQKAIRENVTHLLEVVAILLPGKKTSLKNNVKCERTARPLRVLLDSGGSANLVRKAAVKGLKKSNAKIPVTWKTANGDFTTDRVVKVDFVLPEFTEKVTINQPFHVCNHELEYDMIIGRETLSNLEIVINLKRN